MQNETGDSFFKSRAFLQMFHPPVYIPAQTLGNSVRQAFQKGGQLCIQFIRGILFRGFLCFRSIHGNQNTPDDVFNLIQAHFLFQCPFYRTARHFIKLVRGIFPRPCLVGLAGNRHFHQTLHSAQTERSPESLS